MYTVVTAHDKMRNVADLNGDKICGSIRPICGSVITEGLGLGLG